MMWLASEICEKVVTAPNCVTTLSKKSWLLTVPLALPTMLSTVSVRSGARGDHELRWDDSEVYTFSW